MKIIILGCGKVGFSIARHLSEEDNDLIIIDKKAEALDKVVEIIDVMVIRGNGLSAKTLVEAGVRTADLIICVAGSDETNILCCMTAKKLGVQHTIARVRDPEYANELSKLKRDLDIDMIINPEQQAAIEISRLLRFPGAEGIETFVGGSVELVSFRVIDEYKISGKTISAIFEKKKAGVLIAAVERSGEAIIPHGGFMLANDDVVRVLGKPSEIMEFFKLIGLNMEKIKDAVIIGGGKITYYLAKFLEKTFIKLKIIEIDREKCERLSENLSRCIIINGDGTDEEVLTSEKFDQAGAVICLTDRDEENVVIALWAKQLGNAKTIVKINHINLVLGRNLGIGSVICPNNITAYQIIQYVRGLHNSLIRSHGSSNIKTMYKIADLSEDDDKPTIEALEFDITQSSRCLSMQLKDLKLKTGVLIGCIVRGDSIIIPTGTSSIHDGDTVIIFVKNENVSEFDDILEAN